MDKVVDTSVAMQRQVLQIHTMRKKRQRCSAGNCFRIREGLDLRNGERECLRFVKKALEVKEYVHSERFMDVYDLEVSDEDGDTSRSNTTRENNKIVKE